MGSPECDYDKYPCLSCNDHMFCPKSCVDDHTVATFAPAIVGSKPVGNDGSSERLYCAALGSPLPVTMVVMTCFMKVSMSTECFDGLGVLSPFLNYVVPAPGVIVRSAKEHGDSSLRTGHGGHISVVGARVTRATNNCYRSSDASAGVGTGTTLMEPLHRSVDSRRL